MHRQRGIKGHRREIQEPPNLVKIVFSSRRGCGTLAVRPYMLAVAANQVEELLITQQN